MMPRPSMCHTSSLQIPNDKDQALKVPVRAHFTASIFLSIKGKKRTPELSQKKDMTADTGVITFQKVHFLITFVSLYYVHFMY